MTRRLVLLLPLLWMLLHTSGLLHSDALQTVDDRLYDYYMRYQAAQREPASSSTPRVVVVAIDEKSLTAVGRWPWRRSTLSQLVNGLFKQQHIALLGLDMVFAEPSDAPGDEPSNNTLGNSSDPANDAFALSLAGRPVVLGYQFTQANAAAGAPAQTATRTMGALPEPLFSASAGIHIAPSASAWSGYSANLQSLREAASVAGFLNMQPGSDGVVRSLPLISSYQGKHYASLALTLLSESIEASSITPLSHPLGRYIGLPIGPHAEPADQLLLHGVKANTAVPLGQQGRFYIPYYPRVACRTTTSANTPDLSHNRCEEAFVHVSAIDVISQRLPADTLKNAIVLLGITAPGLALTYNTPLNQTMSSVDIQANALAGLLAQRGLYQPHYAQGYALLLLLVSGGLLIALLPRLSALRSVGLLGVVGLGVLGLHTGLLLGAGLVLPLAPMLVMLALMLVAHMGWGYALEQRAKRALLKRFGTYVPPELVQEMAKNPDQYQLQARNQELTMLFCDIRDFSSLSENMEPTQLQSLLNTIFNRLTHRIRSTRGTIDKYMGDCVMAFWGAPVHEPRHAQWAVQCALEMSSSIHALNQDHRRRGLPLIAVGIGLNTGTVCVGDMGSQLRRSYTVIGAAVNIAARLESLCKTYGVPILAGPSTRAQAPQFVWQEIDDHVYVKGHSQPIRLYHPICPQPQATPALRQEMALWDEFLQAYRQQHNAQAQELLQRLQTLPHSAARQTLYAHYAERLQNARPTPQRA